MRNIIYNNLKSSGVQTELLRNELSCIERLGLEEKYAPFLKKKLDFSRFVTFVPDKKTGIYSWFKYKEAFSRRLVWEIIDFWGLNEKSIVFDLFAGCGTTLMACKERGISSIGIDILPVSVFVSKVKLKDWNNIEALSDAVASLMSLPFTKPKTEFPDVSIIDKAFPQKIKDWILFYKEAILTFEESIRDFLFLGLLSVLEEVSDTRKDGQFLRLVEKRIPSITEILHRKLLSMISDIRNVDSELFPYKKADATIIQGDATKSCLPEKYIGKIDGIITSPPYLNRYDYSRTYALELCTLWINSFKDMREIRNNLLRSHIESPVLEGRNIDIPTIQEILNNLSQKEINNNRIPIMIRGYFEDMNLCIQNMSKYLRTGGRVALVVANARFEGELIPTDLILSEIASQYNLVTTEIWITRFKGNSSQQMAKYGRIPVRESILFWSKS